MRCNSPKLSLDSRIRWWRVVDKRRCFLANLGSVIRELKDLERHRSCKSNLMGSLHRISATRSIGSGGIDVRFFSIEETDSPLSLLPGVSEK